MILKQNPFISVIIPVYKAETYLEQCVSSVLQQTYPSLELILVDDGSPDDCPQLCEKLAAADQRVHVLHKENEGAAFARAAGLSMAKGDYCLFVDGDDWIDPDTLECCVQMALEQESDCVMFGYVREYPGNSIQNPLFEANFSYDRERSEALVHRRLIGPMGQELAAPQRVDNLSSMCMKLFRTEAARRGRIVSDRIVGTSEDTIFNVYALDGCRISYLNRCFYHYRKDNPQSITTHHKPDLAEKWDILYKVFGEYIASSGRQAQYQPAFLNRVACGMIGLGLNEVGSRAGLLKKAKRIRSILEKPLYQEAFEKLDASCCPLQWKIFFFLCRRRLALGLTLLLQLINFLRSRGTA